MKNLVICLGIVLLYSPSVLGQRLTLYGKMSGDDFKVVERTITDIFSQTGLLNLSLYHENTLLTKIDRNKLPNYDEIAGYYSFNEAFVEGIPCASVGRIALQRANESSSGRTSINFVSNACEGFNADYSSFVSSSVSALNMIGTKPYLNMIFTKVKPSVSVTTKIGSNTVLVDKTITGLAKSSSGGNIYIVEDGKVTSKITITNEWQSSLKLDNPVKNIKIFAVNSKGDTSDIISYTNIAFKAINASSLIMLHPGGQIKPNGITSDVVIKCNTQTMNGFYNFQFLVDKDLNLDSVVLNFDDLSGGKVIKRRNLYNVDETLKSMTPRDDGFIKVCVYLLYSEMNFKNPCDIDDSYLYYLSYRLPNGERVETPKKQLFFESFRENYDEFPCSCR
jgi:hypothetical protein